MNCGLLDIGCYAQAMIFNLLAAVPWWAWVAVIVVVLGAAWRIAGVPGLAVAAAAIGYLFGRNRAIDPIEHFDAGHSDAEPPNHPLTPHKVPPVDTRPGHWNRQTGSFNP